MRGKRFMIRQVRLRNCVAAACASLVVFGAAGAALAQTPVKFTLDWRFEGPAAPFTGRARQGVLQGRGARRHDRHRQRLARVDPARRLRHLRHRLRRRELADPLPRREPDDRPQGRDDGLRPAAVRHRRPQEQGHHRRSQEPGGQEVRRAGRRRRLRAVADLQGRQQARRQRHEVRERRLPRARADAGLRRGRCRVRLLVLGLHEPEVARRAGRRHRR